MVLIGLLVLIWRGLRGRKPSRRIWRSSTSFSFQASPMSLLMMAA